MIALHIGADTADGREPARAARDTVARMWRLSASMGVSNQRRLLGPDATVAGVRSAVAGAVAALPPLGLLVLTFSGHSDRRPPHAGWCMADGILPLTDVAEMLADAPATATVVAVLDTCFAASLANFASSPATLVLLAACGADQITFNCPTSAFIVRLERLVRNPRCTTYAWLDWQLGVDTPDAERPQLWTNQPNALQRLPFARAGVVLHSRRREE